ncbi:hypothetical protein J6A31_08820 [bacterium]|nr:hypothetical protein [bacterium]
MPKYKEITINAKLTPEILLGEMLKRATTISAKEQTKTDAKETKITKE